VPYPERASLPDAPYESPEGRGGMGAGAAASSAADAARAELVSSAHCLLPTAYCLLPTAHCPLPTADGPLPPTHYLHAGEPRVCATHAARRDSPDARLQATGAGGGARGGACVSA
jgi:hypothetical protein